LGRKRWAGEGVIRCGICSAHVDPGVERTIFFEELRKFHEIFYLNINAIAFSSGCSFVSSSGGNLRRVTFACRHDYRVSRKKICAMKDVVEGKEGPRMNVV
jgi:hypothetical protein